MSDLETGAAVAAIPTDTPAPATVEAPKPADMPEVEAPSALDADLMAVWEKNNPTGDTEKPAEAGEDRPRDEFGRFVSANPSEETAKAEPTEAKPIQDQEPLSEEKSAEPAKPAIVDPPQSWSREQREKWANLPPETQEYIATRERDAHSQISRLGQQVKQVEPIVQTLEQYKSTFEKNGMSYTDGLQALLRAQSMFDVDPRAAIQTLMQAYGVDFSQPMPEGSAPPAREVLDLKATVARLENELRDTQRRVLSREEHEQEVKTAAVDAKVEAFRRANPDFDIVEDDVAMLIPAMRAKHPDAAPEDVLSKAYDAAVWNHPDLRAKRLGDETKKREEEAVKRAEAARKAASLNVKSKSDARPAPDWMSDMRAIAARGGLR
jgi:hypothetical protein